MKALTWHGRRDVRVDTVPDPTLEQDTDGIVRVTSSGICGSDLHLYEVLGAFLEEGDILGHEPMGIVEAVGSGVSHIRPGDRVVIPFNISCGQDAANAGSGSLAVVLAAIKDWTFLLGPGFVVGIGNGLLLGYLMYRSELVPQPLAMVGPVGGTLICTSGIAVLFDVIQPGGAVQAIATIPEFVWELSLGVYLAFKGFRPSSPILSAPRPDRVVISPTHTNAAVAT